MTEFVANISRTGFTGISYIADRASSSYERLNLSMPSREVMILGGFLCFLQILDGILTGLGMHHFGLDAEGNILLRFLMSQLGYIPALILAKSVAIAVVCILCSLSRRVDWLDSALRLLIVIYLSAAVIPWTAIMLLRVI